ncbi:hypothetical protein BGX26_012354 [Mortierella sp. AD094]|nr:hypothetical protein BGX26_012354 [Mortierella sp. AD094]
MLKGDILGLAQTGINFGHLTVYSTRHAALKGFTIFTQCQQKASFCRIFRQLAKLNVTENEETVKILSELVSRCVSVISDKNITIKIKPMSDA